VHGRELENREMKRERERDERGAERSKAEGGTGRRQKGPPLSTQIGNTHTRRIPIWSGTVHTTQNTLPKPQIKVISSNTSFFLLIKKCLCIIILIHVLTCIEPLCWME